MPRQLPARTAILSLLAGFIALPAASVASFDGLLRPQMSPTVRNSTAPTSAPPAAAKLGGYLEHLVERGISPNVASFIGAANPRMIVRAEGCHYITADGRRVFDSLSGLWCCGMGHNRPEIAEAVAFAEAGAWEPIETLTKHVMAEDRTAAPAPPEPADKTVETTYREAVKQAIRQAMTKDERVFLMGEDVGAYGGCYAVSKGLMAEFGEDRIEAIEPLGNEIDTAFHGLREAGDGVH